MSHKILRGLEQAAEAADKAARVAFIIQSCRDDDISATRTAYRILDALEIAKFHEVSVDPSCGRGDS